MSLFRVGAFVVASAFMAANILQQQKKISLIPQLKQEVSKPWQQLLRLQI